MANAVSMNVADYLTTSFEGADRDYLEGDTEERNRGQALHGTIQFWIGVLLLRLNLGLILIPEVRIRIHERRYRVADLGVWREDADIGIHIPNTPPYLAIEILSPDDRMVRVIPKVHDYLDAGVDFIWIVDPWERQALTYSRVDPTGRASEILTAENPQIRLDLESVLTPRF